MDTDTHSSKINKSEDGIKKEKQQPINNEKIKKDNNPYIIFRGSDNLPYEKVGKNEPVCIADKIPFEILKSAYGKAEVDIYG